MAAMGDGDHANDAGRSFDLIHDAKAPDAEPPEALQLADERRTNRRISGDRTEGRLDRPLHTRRQVS